MHLLSEQVSSNERFDNILRLLLIFRRRVGFQYIVTSFLVQLEMVQTKSEVMHDSIILRVDFKGLEVGH